MFKTILTDTSSVPPRVTFIITVSISNSNGNYLWPISLTLPNSKSTKTINSSSRRAETAIFTFGLKKPYSIKDPEKPSKTDKMT